MVPRAERPYVTYAACLACAILFLGINAEKTLNWTLLAKWGYPSPQGVWGGAYWGPLTSVFVHIAWWHFGMNVYWLVIFGTLCERVMGSVKFAAFFLIAAFVSSGIQLAVSSETGHGASGVVYALFGFTWVTRGYYRQFRTIALERNASAFVIWALVCVIVTWLKIMNIGNGAHISGLLFGVGVGAAFVLEFKKPLIVAVLVLMLASGIVSMFWMPWSAEWRAFHEGRPPVEVDQRKGG